ncbi:hypothetical protein Pcinc_026605 [Petrolisthes cinctipes]|uniref:Uncharacterized protein n=1 Tax=Petrolisthes cinctipes TaxID=88211 RepID=A0AAE1F5J5_PETCI|nr:hypothetical protein Pcinc_026605 [Petrolisthes cinctipes]
MGGYGSGGDVLVGVGGGDIRPFPSSLHPTFPLPSSSLYPTFPLLSSNTPYFLLSSSSHHTTLPSSLHPTFPLLSSTTTPHFLFLPSFLFPPPHFPPSLLHHHTPLPPSFLPSSSLHLTTFQLPPLSSCLPEST